MVEYHSKSHMRIWTLQIYHSSSVLQGRTGQGGPSQQGPEREQSPPG
ncbi:hypothetical protein PT974_02523 [Cladobotryum mycophilum]|uniref:Uncharacterized protein n=1 Tax=Cladobotryum mycophilum TaxID=491253 RepID=A0ABR0SZI0_9HYPO